MVSSARCAASAISTPKVAITNSDHAAGQP
jgi:hypothetical protein